MGVNILSLILFVIMLATLVNAQSECNEVIVGLAPCLGFVTGTTSYPSGICCSHLAKVVKSQPRCLCTVLNGGGAELGTMINQTLALVLPETCKVKTPPPEECNDANEPAPSPKPSKGRQSLAGNETIAQGIAAILTIPRHLILLFVIVAAAHATYLTVSECFFEAERSYNV